MAAAESILKSGEVSAMLKHGFISPPSPTAAINHPSPPPPPSSSSSSSSFPSPRPSTLFDMISRENSLPRPTAPHSPSNLLRLRHRISRLSADARSHWGPPDVDLSVTSKDGTVVSMEAHRAVLAGRSRFFEEKLGGGRGGARVSVDICDCDDVEAYVEVVAMMYCRDLKNRLAGEEVSRVLEFLKVCSAILFDAGVESCLEFLDAAPWSEDEEEMILSTLNQLQLRKSAALLLQRVSTESFTSMRADAIVLQLLAGVLHAKDDKARREMKTLIARLLREDTDRFEVSQETLYHLCHRCLNSLQLCLSEAASMDESRRDRGALMGEIAHEADNVQWLLEILISRKLAEEFVTLWADQVELSSLHSKIQCMYRYEMSNITAQLCIAVGKGQILVSRDARYALLQTWLEALYEDFGWMRRASRSFDKRMVEEGLCQTILTLSMPQQQTILLRWFDHFLNKGDDCPNIQRAFEVWWRRAFIRHYVADEGNSQLEIAVCDYPT